MVARWLKETAVNIGKKMYPSKKALHALCHCKLHNWRDDANRHRRYRKFL